MDAWHLRAVLASIDEDPREVRVIGPGEFAPYLRCLTPLGSITEAFPARGFAWVIVPQGDVAGLPAALRRRLRDNYRCVLENRRYLLFRAAPPTSA